MDNNTISLATVARVAAATALTALVAMAHPLTAHADGAPVPDAYTYDGSSCTSGARTDPLTLVFFGNAFDSPTRTRTPLEIVLDVEDDAFPRYSAIAGGTQYALNGTACQTQISSLGREFGAPRTIRGHHFDHREKKHLRLFNSRESGNLTVSASPHRERKIDCPAPKDPGDAVYKRYNGVGGFDAAAQEQASVLRSKGYDVLRHPAISPAQTTFNQCNGTPVPWSGNVYRVNLP